MPKEDFFRERWRDRFIEELAYLGGEGKFIWGII